MPHSRDGQRPWGGYLDAAALFNVVADPNERHELSADPTHAGRLREMRRLLDDWWCPDND